MPRGAGVVRDIRANMERTSLPEGLDHYGPDDQRNSRQPCPEPGGAAVTVGDPCWQWISSGMGTRPRACEEVSWRAGRSARAARLGRGRWPTQISSATENLPWPIWSGHLLSASAIWPGTEPWGFMSAGGSTPYPHIALCATALKSISSRRTGRIRSDVQERCLLSRASAGPGCSVTRVTLDGRRSRLEPYGNRLESHGAVITRRIDHVVVNRTNARRTPTRARWEFQSRPPFCGGLKTGSVSVPKCVHLPAAQEGGTRRRRSR